MLRNNKVGNHVSRRFKRALGGAVNYSQVAGGESLHERRAHHTWSAILVIDTFKKFFISNLCPRSRLNFFDVKSEISFAYGCLYF